MVLLIHIMVTGFSLVYNFNYKQNKNANIANFCITGKLFWNEAKGTQNLSVNVKDTTFAFWYVCMQRNSPQGEALPFKVVVTKKTFVSWTWVNFTFDLKITGNIYFAKVTVLLYLCMRNYLVRTLTLQKWDSFIIFKLERLFGQNDQHFLTSLFF